MLELEGLLEEVDRVEQRAVAQWGLPLLWHALAHVVTPGLDTHVVREIRVCNSHACAIQLGDWALTLRVAEMTRTLQGADVG